MGSDHPEQVGLNRTSSLCAWDKLDMLEIGSDYSEYVRHGICLKFCVSQLNAWSIGRVFNLFPQSMFLVADDGSVQVPDEDGNLNVDSMDASFVWTCDGDSSKPAESAAGTSCYGSPSVCIPAT